jgi:hypothetical protein
MEIEQSESIKQEFLNAGLNSKIKGIRVKKVLLLCPFIINLSSYNP